MTSRTRQLRLLLLILVGLSLIDGCAAIPRIDASGSVAGYSLRGPVDHPLARDYLGGRPLPSALQVVRERYLSSGTVPSREVLAELSVAYSPDVATLLLVEALSARPETRDLRARYEAELALVRRVGADNAAPALPTICSCSWCRGGSMCPTAERPTRTSESSAASTSAGASRIVWCQSLKTARWKTTPGSWRIRCGKHPAGIESSS
jgi:hypothetical protein